MKQKLKLLITVILLSPLIGGLYGIVHDQITYSISEEYYTKFKFYQFQINPYFHNRLGVSIVGFLATWWVGLPIGLLIGLFSLLQKNEIMMKRAIIKGLSIAIVITFLTPVIAILLWFIPKYFTPLEYESYAFDLSSFVPPHEKINNPLAFYMVGLIHNYSYLGGLIGLIAGIILNFRVKKRNETAGNIHKKKLYGIRQ